LFVRHAPLRTLRRTVRRARPHTSGLLGPLALAATLAVAGHQLAAVQAATGRALPVAAYAAERPEHAPAARRHPLRARANVVTRAATAAPGRATRSAARRPLGSGWVRPAGGPLTSGFGYRWGKLHKGIDLGAPYGSPIYAAAAGVVTYAGPESGYGRLVTIRHADGTVTAYGHMSRIATHAGARVAAGEVIAYVGSEGHSTGPHLHFEVRIGGTVPIDPLPFLRARGVRI
jgi:murein DD-endopeptidase MepM/ murein hydrolase activator NlpD